MRVLFILLTLSIFKFVNSTATSLRKFQELLLLGTLKDCIKTREPISPRVCRKPNLLAFRTIEGFCNNLENPNQGASETEVPRFLPAQYFDPDGLDTPYGHPFLLKDNIPTAQDVSDKLFQIIDRDDGNEEKLSHIFMTFGQFIDHDLVYMLFNREACKDTECKIPTDFAYPCFPIIGSKKKTRCVRLVRSFAACQDPTKPRQVRNNVNNITSYLDGSMIYGSEDRHAGRVRGRNGLLRVTRTRVGDLLPFDLELDEPCNEDRERFFNRRNRGCFLGGDVRASENTALAGMHTIFVRLHNHYARRLRRLNRRRWSSERIFQETRKIVVAIVQQITYNEWLPEIIQDLPDYSYNPRADASIRNVFGSAAFRFGHTLVKNAFQQLNPNFNDTRAPIPIRNTFFDMTSIFRDGIEPTMFGLIANLSETVDTKFSASIGRDLFIPPREKGFQNLAALNIQRGRDHGIPSYTKFVEFCFRRRVRSFNDFREIRDRRALRLLRQVYGSVDNYIDIFPALLAEEPANGKLLGPTLQCIIRSQFLNLRDGDRFFFENAGQFTPRQLSEIKKMTLARVMCLTMRKIVSIQDNVFKVFEGNRNRPSCDNFDYLDIEQFRDGSK